MKLVLKCLPNVRSLVPYQLKLAPICLIYVYRENYFLNGPTRAFYIVYYRSFQTNIITIFCKKYKYVKNVHPVYGAGIRTHDLWNVSLLPQPLDQGSCPKLFLVFPFLFDPFFWQIIFSATGTQTRMTPTKVASEAMP